MHLRALQDFARQGDKKGLAMFPTKERKGHMEKKGIQPGEGEGGPRTGALNTWAMGPTAVLNSRCLKYAVVCGGWGARPGEM